MTRKIVFSLALGAALAACDSIPADDRYIEVEAVKVERTVLLEDFTGQNCVNCPSAHTIIEALEEQYAGHLVAVSIHAGVFGISADNKRYTGLMQEEGNVYNDRYGIDEYPKGVVDGHTPPINADQWAAAVYTDIQQTTPLSITLDAAVGDDGELDIDCTLSVTEDVDGTLYVWLTESGIVARQEDKDLGRIPDYVHNNVFRACVNGVDGEGVALRIGEPHSVSYTLPVKNTDTEKWNPANMAAVAFVKNASGVVQAARCSVSLNE
ncbi:MAG: Omp28 family outer membrane lipoprotein [Muribaculaceae bacterium]|nr:Omp28 family outer membrane lipoprotein [Muribaculaceae bacterium]